MSNNTQCYGECLRQQDDGEYIDEENLDCPFRCRPMECPNYRLCGKKLPQWVLFCNEGICTNCASKFGSDENGKYYRPNYGKLTFSETQMECPICLESSVSNVQYPHCQHFICLPCFRKCYHLDEESSSVLLPYPEEEMEEKPEDDPQILLHNHLCELEEDERCAAYEESASNRKCCLCRK